jgi:hypothetical protein
VSHQFVAGLHDAIPACVWACVGHLIGIVSFAQKNGESGRTGTEKTGQLSLGNGHRQEQTKKAEDPQGSCCSLELWEKGTVRGTNSRIGTNGEKQDVQADLANVSERKHTLSVVDSKRG